MQVTAFGVVTANGETGSLPTGVNFQFSSTPDVPPITSPFETPPPGWAAMSQNTASAYYNGEHLQPPGPGAPQEQRVRSLYRCISAHSDTCLLGALPLHLHQLSRLVQNTEST